MPKSRDKESSENSKTLILFCYNDNIVVDYGFKPWLNRGIPVFGFVFRVGLKLKHNWPSDDWVVLTILAVTQAGKIYCNLAEVPGSVKLYSVAKTYDIDGQ